MWNFKSKTVTLYIDDTSVRLLVTQGLQVKNWADLKLEPGLIKGGVVDREKEVAGRIKQLLKDQKIKTKKVTLGFSGLHSLTRPATLPELPGAMLAEAVAREARRLLPVPLDQLYLSWRTLPSTKGKTRVFMVATPRKTADSLVRTLRLAGLEAARMAVKPLALTKIIPVNTAVLIDVQPSEFDIVVLADGVPQPMRTVSFPEGEPSLQTKLGLIIGDFDRTLKFYDTNNPDKPLDPRAPVFVSGESECSAELIKTLGAAAGRSVSALSTPLKGSEQLDLGRYLVNAAMAVKTPSPIREPTFPVANLNVLPAPYQPKPISMARVIGIPGGAAVVVLVVPMLIVMQSTASNIASMQNRLDTTNKMIAQKQTQKLDLTRSIADLQKKATTAKTSVDNLKLALASLSSSHAVVNGDLQLALSIVPQAVTLTSINESGTSLVLSGNSTDEQSILNYARGFDLSKKYSETTVTSITVAPPTAAPAGTAGTSGISAPNGTAGSVAFTITLLRE